MSSQALILQAEKRDVVGKKVRALRRSGKIPAVVFERGKESEHISVDALPLAKIWANAGKHHMIQIEIGTTKRMTLIKDVAFDPVKGSLTHVAFHAIKQNEKVEAEIPVEIIGEIPAERLGFFLVRPILVVEVKALPGNLPDKLEVSGEGLAEVGDTVTVADLKVPADVEVLTEADRALAVVEEARANIEAEEAEAAEGEAGEAAEVPSDHGNKESEDKKPE